SGRSFPIPSDTPPRRGDDNACADPSNQTNVFGPLGLLEQQILVRAYELAAIGGCMESLQQRIQRVVREDVALVPYDPRWPELFREEKDHLLSCLPKDLIRRIEHFGSTAVPGLTAKPIIDILVEVTDLQSARAQIALI